MLFSYLRLGLSPSARNDDNTDNRFYEKMGRFPEIEEDEPPYRLLCNEYPAAE